MNFDAKKVFQLFCEELERQKIPVTVKETLYFDAFTRAIEKSLVNPNLGRRSPRRPKRPARQGVLYGVPEED